MSKLIRGVNFHKWHKNAHFLAILPCANAWLKVTKKKRKRSGCYASLPEAQLGAGGSTSDNLADVTRVWSFLGPRREILTLPLAAEQYGELISCICLASSL